MLLSDDLGIEMRSRLGDEGVHRLEFIIRKSGRIAMVLSLSDMQPRHQRETEMRGLDVDQTNAAKLYRMHLCAEIAIHEDGARDILREARMRVGEDDPVFASIYCEAVAKLDRKEGRTQRKLVHWLLATIFADHLSLWSLLEYKPSLPAKVHAKLVKFHTGVGQAFADWRRPVQRRPGT